MTALFRLRSCALRLRPIHIMYLATQMVAIVSGVQYNI